VTLRGALARMDPWTPEEDACLRAAYVDGGIKQAMRALPDRSEFSLYQRARRLGLSRRARWTPEDDRRLRFEWGDGVSLKTIGERLGRSPLTIYWRAQKLGLSLGVPDGFEYLTHAAVRTGYSTGQLRRILDAHGVRLHRVLARDTGKRRSRRMHFVDPLDVDEAVAAWGKTETPEEAARRLGICADRLRERLAKIGIANAPGTKKRLRVTDEQVAAANGIAKWNRRSRRRGSVSSSAGGRG
jgi:hypothetical protein